MKEEEKIKDDRKDSVLRFQIIFAILSIFGIYVLGMALQTMLFRSEYWKEVEQRFTKENIPIPPNRGNILDCNGELLAGTLPEWDGRLQ